MIGQYGPFSKNNNNLRFSSLGPNLNNNLDAGSIFRNGPKKPKIFDYSDYCSKPGPPWPARPALARPGPTWPVCPASPAHPDPPDPRVQPGAPRPA